MPGYTQESVLRALHVLNPWWSEGTQAKSELHPSRRRLFDTLDAHFRQSQALPALVVGLRRIGKTTLALQVVQSVAERLRLPSSNSLYLDCQASLLAGMPLADLFDAFDRHVRDAERPCVVVIDEVQYPESWHLQLRDLIHRTKRTDVLILATGSNPGELRRASGRELLDRVMLFPMRTMSFGECVELMGQRVPRDVSEAPEITRAFEGFLFRGGFPALWSTESSLQESRKRLSEMCDRQVIDGDVAARLGIRNLTGFRKLWAHLVTHPGEEFNASALGKGLSLGSEGVGAWCEGLLQVELLSEVLPTETSGAPLHGIKRHSRLYPSDHALAAAYGIDTTQGHGLETLVLRQLREIAHGLERKAAGGAFVGFWKSRSQGKSRDIDFRLVSGAIDLPVSVKGARGPSNDDLARLAVVAKQLGASRALLVHMGLSRSKTVKQGVDLFSLPILAFLLRADRCEEDVDALFAD